MAGVVVVAGAGAPPKTALTVLGCAPRMPADLNPRTVAASAAVVAFPPRTALAVAAVDASLSRSRAYRSLRSRRSAPTGTIAFGSGASGVMVALLADVAMLEAAVVAAVVSGASSPSFALHQNRCPSLHAVLWHSFPQYLAFRHRRHLANSRGYSSQRPQSTEGNQDLVHRTEKSRTYCWHTV